MIHREVSLLAGAAACVPQHRVAAIEDTVRVATAGLGEEARQIARLAATIAFDAGFAMRELIRAGTADAAGAPSIPGQQTEDEEP